MYENTYFSKNHLYLAISKFFLNLLFQYSLDEDTPPKEVEEEDDGDENEENKIPTKKITRSIRKHLEKIKQQENHVAYQKENNKRNVYPTDLWFLLANKIQPEQVKAFSLICKDAYNVITTRKFWLELYKRLVDLIY